MKVLTIVGSIIGVFATIFVLQVLGMVNLKFFGTWREEIRYDIQKESQAHRDGLQRNLMAMQTDYLNADSAGKAAIMAAVRHQYSQADTSEFPDHLKTFLSEMGVY